jgi:rhamnogalacturonyl hydrolase YesR
MQSVVEAVDAETGAWWRIMDQPGKEGNYIESSASAMFVYSLMKGVWVGVLETKACVDVAVKAWAYLTGTFVVDHGNGTFGWNGTMSV